MASNFISAYLIYNGGSNTYVDNGSVVTINCDDLQAFTPVPAYLQRWLPAGDGTDIISQLTFNTSSADQLGYGTNLIQGVWVEQNGIGMLIDVPSVNTVINACNQCCTSSPGVSLPRFYTGGITPFATPTTQTYCVTRLDDGSAYSHNLFSSDYVGRFTGIARLMSNLSGVSRYSVQSYVGWPPVAIGTDVVATGTC